MRILQIGLSANQGGIESCIVNYYSHLNREKIQFDFADIIGDGIAYADKIKHCGGQIFSLPGCKTHPFQTACRLKKIISRGEYDIIHINVLSAANLLPVLVSCGSGKGTIIVHSHNSAVPSGILRKVLNAVNTPILRNLPVEKWACSIMAGKWLWGKGFNENNVIPNAVDREIFHYDEFKRSRMREANGIKKEDIVLGYVGRLIEQKNPLFLIDILNCAVKSIPNIKLLVVGGGPLLNRFKEKVCECRLQEKVCLTGPQKEIADWYQAMDVFLLPSYFEGLPVVGIEAQAMGLPCLVSNMVTEELNITKGVSYLPIDRGPGVWAEKIKSILQNTKTDNFYFPGQYEIRNAAQCLQQKYLLLAKGAKK